MSTNFIWSTAANWTNWRNSDQSAVHVDGNSLTLQPRNLPTSELSIVSSIGYWPIGRTQSKEDTFSGAPGNVTTLNNNAAVVSNGLSVPTAADYASITSANLSWTVSLDYQIGCWFRSTALDYSNRIGMIWGRVIAGGVTTGAHYVIYVDTDNIIKARINLSTGQVLLNSGIEIDGEWHWVLLATKGTSGHYQRLYIDNELVASATTAANAATPGAGNITIGSYGFDTSQGFAGYIDEIFADTGDSSFSTTARRFIQDHLVSNVVSVSENEQMITAINANFSTPNGATVEFGFRASNLTFSQFDTDVPWSVYTLPGRVLSGYTASLSELGINPRGKYFQVRARMTPSTSDSPTADILQRSAPQISSLTMYTGQGAVPLFTANTAFESGTILGQVVPAEALGIDEYITWRTISKASLYLNVSETDRQEYFDGIDGIVSFAAANFQEVYRQHEWEIKPTDGNINGNGSYEREDFTTVAQGRLSSRLGGAPDYTLAAETYVNAPKVTYKLFFEEEGIYRIWMRGFQIEAAPKYGFWYCWNTDTTPAPVSLSSNPTTLGWTKIGEFYAEENSHHELHIFQGSTEVELDQFYIVNQQETVSGTSPFGLSEGPFNLFCRIRLSDEDNIYSTAGNNVGRVDQAWGWISSNDIHGSGWYNFEIPDIRFTHPLTIELIHIGGSNKWNAAWNFNFADNVNNLLGRGWRSRDWGMNFNLVE